MFFIKCLWFIIVFSTLISFKYKKYPAPYINTTNIKFSDKTVGMWILGSEPDITKRDVEYGNNNIAICLNTRLIAALLLVGIFSSFPISFTKGADKSAPPGTTNKPIIEGIIINIAFLLLITFSIELTILSNKLYCFMRPPSIDTIITDSIVDMDEESLNTFIIESTRESGPDLDKIPSMRAVIKREWLNLNFSLINMGINKKEMITMAMECILSTYLTKNRNLNDYITLFI